MNLRGIRAALPVMTLLGAGAAQAGDTASLNVIGYSSDARIFAFEEYGIQDGSGFAYSNYYFIDTETDSYVAGTPIRVLSEQEMSVAKTRAEARAKARDLIGKYQMEDHPGVLLAYNPSSEYDSDPHRLRYFGGNPQYSQSYTLVLDQKEFPAPKDCENMVGTYSGFSLRWTEQESQPADKLLYADDTVPKSRFCPNGYRIGAVVGHPEQSNRQIAMILLSRFGFEGNDERWLAVPLDPYKTVAKP